ncbi:MAG: domain containing protein [Chloroflexi bacterium]|nr:domain containing protein [Chloroflexota bacterium]
MDPSSALNGVTPIGPPRTVEIEDRYLDTAGRAMAGAGFVARVRTGTGPSRLTLKSMARRGTGAVHRRLEIEADAAEGDDPSRWPPSPARDRVLEIVRGEPLLTLASIRQRRLQRDVALGASVIELSLDDVTVGGDTWTELECELRSGLEADLAALGASLLRRDDLAPATTSKLDRALRASGVAFTKR